jgi:hypothetical protein
MEQSHSAEAGEEIRHILWYLSVHYHLRNSPPMGCVLNQIIWIIISLNIFAIYTYAFQIFSFPLRIRLERVHSILSHEFCTFHLSDSP